MEVWITRDKGKFKDEIYKWSSKPKVRDKFFYDGGVLMASYAGWRFEELFGFLPEVGTCKKYNLTLTEVK